ncbi:MAG TPA: LysR family transcriptional regulator [Acidimicrobiales bacterium]|nr:LysR family transcriptional regulator [Acidimicrobiales bacterium]
MDLRQLSALVAVADNGTFSAAADVLHTVQSNVSTHVARLEKELGVTLVDRSAGHLTMEGEAVVARARRVGMELEALVSDIAALRHEVVGTARLGVIGTTGRWLVPHLLEVTARRHPKLRLVVVEGISTSLEPQLAAGVIDLAVVNVPVPDDDLVAQPLFAEDLVLVVPARDPLAKEGPVSLAHLAEIPLLLPTPGTAFRDELDAAVRQAGVTLQAKVELDGTPLIASLTFEGLGPAILPATAVPAYLRQEFALVGVEGIPRRHIGVAQRRRGLPSAASRAVLEMMHELVADASARPRGIHPAG